MRIALGTDSGPPGRFQGYFEHLELEMMVQAGLTPERALRAATGDAAICLGQAGLIGTLTPGAWADFLLLTADPLADIRHTRAIESVWISGNARAAAGSALRRGGPLLGHGREALAPRGVARPLVVP